MACALLELYKCESDIVWCEGLRHDPPIFDRAWDGAGGRRELLDESLGLFGDGIFREPQFSAAKLAVMLERCGRSDSVEDWLTDSKADAISALSGYVLCSDPERLGAYSGLLTENRAFLRALHYAADWFDEDGDRVGRRGALSPETYLGLVHGLSAVSQSCRSIRSELHCGPHSFEDAPEDGPLPDSLARDLDCDVGKWGDGVDPRELLEGLEGRSDRVLRHDAERLYWYTSLSSAYHLFDTVGLADGRSGNALTVMHSSCMNDPTEGRTLTGLLSREGGAEMLGRWMGAYTGETFTFVKSFTPLRDKLYMWSLYGRGDEPGDGCCVCFSDGMFAPSGTARSSRLVGGLFGYPDESADIYCVAYVDQDGLARISERGGGKKAKDLRAISKDSVAPFPKCALLLMK